MTPGNELGAPQSTAPAGGRSTLQLGPPGSELIDAGPLSALGRFPQKLNPGQGRSLLKFVSANMPTSTIER